MTRVFTQTFGVVGGLLERDGKILLVREAQRKGPDNGKWNHPAGWIDVGENPIEAVKREVLEEVGLDVAESEFELMHTFHRKGDQEELIALCFIADVSHMHPKNNEPTKHDDMKFFNVDQLPENIIPAHAQAINCIKQDISYSEHGFKKVIY